MQASELSALNSTLLWGAFIISLCFGAIAQRTHFCTMGAISDVVNMGDWTRMRQWGMAVGVAMIGFSILAYGGWINPAKSIYASTRWLWLSALVGGFLFGLGMVLGSGCGSKTLVRIGSGNLKAFVVFLVMGVAAFATLKGITAVLRVATVERVGIADSTLNRFFALHVIALPLVLLLLVVLHLGALHEVGSNNPDGVDIKKNKGPDGKPLDGIPFHPYYTIGKDLFGVMFFLLICAFIIFFEPTFGGLFLEHDNFIVANPMVTPEHIKPVWYFTAFYAMLRAVPAMFGSQFPGVVVMGAAVMILFLVPWLDRSPVKSMRYRPTLHRVLLGVLVVTFVWLMYLGMVPPTDTLTMVARVLTFIYFAWFIAMPVWSRMGTFKPVPQRVTMHD